MVENTVGKGESARYEQFLLFPQCFQTNCTADTKKHGLFWERVKRFVAKYAYGKKEKKAFKRYFANILYKMFVL